MKGNLLHTPEGVRDIYNEECSQKMILQENLQRLIKQYGFAAIQTPTFEFFDIFNQEIGTTPANELYKFFDREGNILVLRPDITPSIARFVSKYYLEEDLPIRLWYQGNIFINHSSYQGRLKESTQLGIELIGDDSVDAEAEILALAVHSLKTAGLQEFQLTIGHTDFFYGLAQAAQLSEEVVEQLLPLISNKNFFGVEALLQPLPIPNDLKQLFQKLGTLYTSSKQLQEVKQLAVSYPLIHNAITHLCYLYEILAGYDVTGYITIELGMVSNYRYYTGIIFAGYTFGSGEAVLKGGRYDRLLPYFGKNASSIGFALVIDQLMAALARQKIKIPVSYCCQLVVYQIKQRQQAIILAQKLRASGTEVMLVIWKDNKKREDYLAYASRMRMSKTVFLEDSERTS
jgi:ATP phosphoribosyltransferase regulatory subunit